ncbi:GDSL esterase/lipase At4g28780-like [Trifolium pratense]|uniref:GDSL esterase/lipase At4g28780-like n=1 Tax=Trifolium pratense TaxID=57577 RepID=UPI001E693C91|nr:GDSL esterase/lipase At4g28780-like [Trifolium pratense]
MAKFASIFFFFTLSLAMLDMYVANEVKVKVVPTLFIFGDSTFDVGTNNFINTLAKANVPFYGVDFPYSIPTGRFSNGLNTADQIAKQFGYQKSPLPFLALEKFQNGFKKSILNGVNFASGGSGILRQTGQKQWQEVVFLEKQVEQFAQVRGNITQILGPSKAAKFVSKAVFLISTGSNDLFDFASNDSNIHFGLEEYFSLLQLNYFSQLRNLYELGARKFGILSVAPIGCCPAVTFANGGNCVKPLNDLAIVFYKATQAVLQKLSSELEDFEYSLANTFAMTSALLNSPSTFGLNETKSACCGIGKFNGEGPCLKALNASLCSNRDDHLFWDLFHPTEKASELAAATIFTGGKEFVSPKNFSQLNC